MPEYRNQTNPRSGGTSARRASNGRRNTRRRSRSNPLAFVLLAALTIIAAGGLVLYMIGYRYINLNGVKFSGFVKDEQPINGTVRYADGVSGKLTKEPDSANGVIRYNNGDVYEGELKGILRDGTGTLTSKEHDSVYTGDFKDDKMTGSAVYTIADKFTYTGGFEDGKYSGVGKAVYPDGSTYYGEWANHMRNGVGEEHYADGSAYYGSFVDDKRNGSTEVSVPLENGGVYNGKPKNVFANGDEYVGDYQNGRRTGNGKYIWASGEYYEGAFVADTMNGMGTYHFNGSTPPYTGLFENGQIVENGAQTTPDTADTEE